MTSPTTDRRHGLVGNTPIKAPVACVATTNITLAGEQTIDGFATNASRVLVIGQADATRNGIYDTNTAAWTRSADADGTYDLAKGSLVYVTGGTNYASSFYVQTTDRPVIGSTPLTFSKSLTGSAATLDFIQAGTAAVDRSAQDKMRERVSAKDFGAIGNSNGTHNNGNDDTTKIQAALDYLGSVGGGTLVLTNTDGWYRITSGLKIPSFVTIEGTASSGYPYNGGAVTSGLLADFSNANQWVIEPKTTVGGNAVGYNTLIEAFPSGVTYNCGVRNLQINCVNAVPFGGIRMHGCPGSIVENVSIVGAGCGLLVNFCFGGKYRIHTISSYYGCAVMSAVNACEFDIYATISNQTDTIPSGYILSAMNSLNGSLVNDFKFSTEAHYNRPWGLAVVGNPVNICANNEISVTVENFSGSQFHLYSYGTVLKRNYQEAPANVMKFVHAASFSLITSLSTHAYCSGTGAMFDLGITLQCKFTMLGLISVASWGTGPFLDTTSLVMIDGISPDSLGPSPPQFNVVHSSAGTGWVAPTPLNAWTNAGSPNEVAGYRLNSRTGNVELKGVVTGGVGDTNAFILPAGFRPLMKRTFPGNAVVVLATGEVIPTASAQTSFDGVSFQALL